MATATEYGSLILRVRTPLSDGTMKHDTIGWKEFVTASAVQANVDGLVFMQGTVKAHDQGSYDNVVQVAALISH